MEPKLADMGMWELMEPKLADMGMWELMAFQGGFVTWNHSN